VLYYEGLTSDCPDANDRLHTFVLEGVPETARRLERLGIGYAFHLQTRQSEANGILYRLTEDAAAIVTDDYPAFTPSEIRVAYHAVDSSCVVP